MIGIYRIYHRESGRSYIGQSVNIENRIRQHFRGTDTTIYLDRAIAKYGVEVFAYEVIELCSAENLYARECHWIATLDCMRPNGYNLQTGGDGGGRPSVDVKRKIGDANKGNKRPDLAEYNRRTKKGQTPWNKGIPRSEETKRKLSDLNKGQVPWNKGKKMSAEARKRMSEAKQGYIPWMKGKKHTPEAIKKMSESTKRQQRPRDAKGRFKKGKD